MTLWTRPPFKIWNGNPKPHRLFLRLCFESFVSIGGKCKWKTTYVGRMDDERTSVLVIAFRRRSSNTKHHNNRISIHFGPLPCLVLFTFSQTITSTTMSPLGSVLLAPSPAGGEKVYDFMYYLKGAAAGGICCSITHGALTPVDVVKTRVQLDPVKVC
eukprot:scaffold11639_cov172-Amphora_coffeaeformis.AAC.18